MTIDHAFDPLSRRAMLGRGALLVAAGALAGGAAHAAPGKLAQKMVAYQATPKGGQRCDKCKQWQAPNACTVVAGEIAPTGWCSIFVKA